MLVDAELGAGRHEVTWDGRDATGQRLASGSYLARLMADGQMRSLMMGLVK
jgi:flagellar hook assembly protein FlgD